MHIPDGFLDTRTAVVCAGLAATAVGVAGAHLRHTVAPSRLPVLGLAAAFLFAAQMVNFPVLGGTSGHLIGSTLAVLLFGPPGAVIVMTAILIIQALLFADGGVLALGANILNMAVVAPMVGSGVATLLGRILPSGPRWKLTTAGFAAWCSVVAASLLCVGELAWSGTVAWNSALPAMVGLHALIGIGEALITMIVLTSIASLRPELLERDPASRLRMGPVLVYGALVVAAVALFVSPFASPWPDGLERVAEHLGFSSRALEHAGTAWFPDYRIPGLATVHLSTGLAGVVGAVVAFLLVLGAASVLSWRRSGGRARP